MLSALIFLVVVLPIANWIMLKGKPVIRCVSVTIGLIALVAFTFNLGRMTGLSMAWYHWKSEYKEPLWQWQGELSTDLKSGDTNAIIDSIRRFSAEDVYAYGREKLFTRGKFHDFVDAQESLRAGFKE